MISYFKKYFKNSPTKQAFLQKNLIPFDLGKMIRVGNNKDGGYVVSENGIKSCEFLLSIGLGFHFSFEKDFLKLKKSDSLLIESYDNSVSKKIMREYSTQNLIRLFFRPSFKAFQRSIRYFEYLLLFNSSKAIHVEKNVSEKKSENSETLNSIFQYLKQNNLVKIDIEGGEYILIYDIINNFNKINILIIEFHNLSNLENREKFVFFFKKVSEYFYLSHLHMNNSNGVSVDNFPDTIEFTFEKKCLLKTNVKKKLVNFPLDKLDYPNSKSTGDYNLIFK